MTFCALALLAGVGVFAATAVARTGGGVAPNPRKVCTDERGDSGRFEVVLGLTKNRRAAQELQTRARHAGFGTRIERDSCTKYEVEVGRFQTRAAARRALDRVKRAGFRHATIEADPKVSGGTGTTATSPDPGTTTTATGTTSTGGGGAGGGGNHTTTTTTTTKKKTTTATTTTTTTTASATTTPSCTLKPKPDVHAQFEVVFGRAPTLAAAQTLLARTIEAGFATAIEVDSCTEFEVAIAGFHTRATAAVVVAEAHEAGFSAAQIEAS